MGGSVVVLYYVAALIDQRDIRGLVRKDSVPAAWNGEAELPPLKKSRAAKEKEVGLKGRSPSIVGDPKKWGLGLGTPPVPPSFVPPLPTNDPSSAHTHTVHIRKGRKKIFKKS